MKKCPFCNADIQENARFCLYCMTPLTEKQVITPKKKKWLWFVLPVVGMLAVLWLAVGLRSSHTQPDVALEQPPQTFQTRDTAEQLLETTGSTQAQTLPIESTPEQTTPKQNKAENLVPPDATTGPSTKPGPKPPVGSGTEPSTGPDTEPSETTEPSEALTQPPEETTEATTEPDDPVDYGNGIPGTTGYRTQYSIANSDPSCDDDVPFNPAGTNCFDYSRATKVDLVGSGVSYTGDQWVLEGNSSRVRCGIYSAGGYIRGEPVVAIRDVWVNDIVSLTVSESVMNICSGALSGCYELKYLQLKGDTVSIQPGALPLISKRWYTIVIRTSADCKDGSGRYWKDIAGEYGAVWEEWNG